MRSAGFYMICFLGMMGTVIRAQSPTSLIVSLEYDGERLESVLKHIERSYPVHFAYSEAYLPVDHPVYIQAYDEPLGEALDRIFSGTSIIVSREIRSTIILKEDPDKLARLELLSMGQPKPIQETDPREEWMADLQKERSRMTKKLPDIVRPDFARLPGGDHISEIDLDKYRLAQMIFEEEGVAESAVKTVSDHSLVQVSVLPFLGTNSFRSHEMTNNFSINVFWGTNGGVDGVEVGGFVNTVTNDVKGIQMAGFANTVGGSVSGTQISGLFNVNNGDTYGFQFAGAFNLTNETHAVQFGGLFNIAKQDASGAQLAGLFNVGSGTAGTQVATLFNHSGDSTKTQVAGLFNAAGDIDGGQASIFYNKAKNVKGVQIGLINVADSVSGVSLGLLNFVKKGYNRVEVGPNETLYANLGLKLGNRSFYNILHSGARWDRLTRNVGETPQEGVYMSWGIGYGFGTVITFSPRWLMNIEAVAIHINEYERWTSKLNLLNQLRLTFDRKTKGSASYFFGPVGNVMASKRIDPETGVVGTSIAPYTLVDQTNGDTNVKIWVGAYAGLRF